MRICSIICSFNSPKLTDRVYKGLLKNEEHDIFILENSTHEDKMYNKGNIIDLGRENVGFGGMHDFIWSEPRFREYDFVGIYNNDVFDIPKNYITTIKKYLNKDIGIISSVFEGKGTSWAHMRRVHKDGLRDVGHVEDMAAFFNTEMFDELCRYIPYHRHGLLDISLAVLYKDKGYRTVVIDDIIMGHMLSGARKEAGVYEEYLVNLGGEMVNWHNRHPNLKNMYNGYLKSITKDIVVVIPNYNHNHLIRAAALSVIESGLSADIVIIDDHSDVSSYDEVKDLPVRWFRHDRNRGLAQSRNTGIANSNAKWIIPLDADDTFLPGGLKALWDSRDKGDVIYGNLVWKDNGIQLKPGMSIYKEQSPEALFMVNNQILGSSLYRRQRRESVGGYWEEHKEFFEDWDLWGRVEKKGYKFHYVDYDVYSYAGGPDGMCARVGREREKNMKIVKDHIKAS